MSSVDRKGRNQRRGTGASHKQGNDSQVYITIDF
jgi:hypothetical protein